MTIKSNNRGEEVTMQYGPELADMVAAIEAAGAINEDGIIQADEAAKIFADATIGEMRCTSHVSLSPVRKSRVCDCTTVVVNGETVHELTCSLFDGLALSGQEVRNVR